MRVILNGEHAFAVFSDALSKQLGDVANKTLGLVPAYAGVGYRLSEHALIYLLRAVLKIAFDHQALDYRAYVAGMTAAVQHFF